MDYFFDTHFHAMTLAHPSFISFMESIEGGLPEFITGGALSPSYIFTPSNRKGMQMLYTLMNALSAFERPIGEIFAMMDDDLRGLYTQPAGKAHAGSEYPQQSYIRDGKFHFRNRTYDKMAMCPLVMDFSQDQKEWDKIYYRCDQPQKILGYAQDTLDGIDWYYANRPEGLFEFYPMLGINPAVHDVAFIEKLLGMINPDHRRIPPQDAIAPSGEQRKRFYGVKFYPPLGTNPWPEESPQELEKVKLIYRYCVDHELPIVTHCDDQGFRGVPAKTAWQYTAPSSWRPVFEHFPDLKVDFAHYGKQYSIASGKRPLSMITAVANKMPESAWFYEIVDLMKEYPGVYADVSFSGTSPEFYEHLLHFIESSEPETADRILERTMFGSDFSVNLLKVESYTSYYRLFERSPFSDAQVLAFAQTNPMRFFGIREEAPKPKRKWYRRQPKRP